MEKYIKIKQNDSRLMNRAAKIGVSPRVIDSFFCINNPSGKIDMYTIMEKIDGVNLSERPLTATLIRKVRAVLNKLTKIGIAHRDANNIENFMVTPKGDVYLIDFGLAREFKNMDRLACEFEMCRHNEEEGKTEKDQLIVELTAKLLAVSNS